MSKSIQQIVKERGITTVYHFTLSTNLPYILGEDENTNGVLATQELKKRQTIALNVTDPNRYDGHPEAISCSISFPNKYYFKAAQERNETEYQDWVILSIDSKVLDEKTLFSPFNAAISSGRYIGTGPEKFEELFQAEISKPNGDIFRRPINRSPKLPTDIQAEALIQKRIPKELINGIYFSSSNVQTEYYRLKLWLGEDELRHLGIGIYETDANGHVSSFRKLAVEYLESGNF